MNKSFLMEIWGRMTWAPRSLLLWSSENFCLQGKSGLLSQPKLPIQFKTPTSAKCSAVLHFAQFHEIGLCQLQGALLPTDVTYYHSYCKRNIWRLVTYTYAKAEMHAEYYVNSRSVECLEKSDGCCRPARRYTGCCALRWPAWRKIGLLELKKNKAITNSWAATMHAAPPSIFSVVQCSFSASTSLFLTGEDTFPRCHSPPGLSNGIQRQPWK